MLILFAGYAAFGPGFGGSGLELKAIFSNSNQLEAGSDIRIAGTSIGSVARIAPGPDNTTIVTMTIHNRTVPIRAGWESGGDGGG
jgi:ABC-type transporter Mla subunit MlaD